MESRPTIWVGFLVLALLGLSSPTESRSGFDGIPGNFCRYRQPSECCGGRFDDCAVPIRGTYCYCDKFCLEGNPEVNDCCPDFYEVCLGQKNTSLPRRPVVPPESNYPQDSPVPYQIYCTTEDGATIPNGGSIKTNCNECRCVNGNLHCENDKCMVDSDIINTINKSPRIVNGWRAANYSEYWGRKAREGLQLRTGTLSPMDLSDEMHPILLRPNMSQIPVSFDARKKREWAGRVGDICDQGWCGASWAFSTLGVAQDRLAIVARALGRIELSAQHLLSCAELGQDGCRGGHIDRAWNYFRKVGISKEECYKYESGKSGKVPKCLIRPNDLSRLTCEHKDLYKMEPAYRISGKEEDIQWEILNNGPVQALMTVHPDLFVYESGVYSYSGLDNGTAETSTHSVRIIGWGSTRMLGSQPVKYWLVANSWGTQWGEGGYFRIRRGTNECGIESFVIAARVKLANLMYGNRH